MNFYFLFVILKKTLLFWLFNFTFGFPVVYFLKNKLENKIVGITQLVGLSFLTILLFWLNFLKVRQDVYLITVIIAITSFLFTLILIINDIKHSVKYKEIFLKFFSIFRSDIYQYLVYVLFVLILVFPQKTFPPLIPSYEVNHDPIVILSFSKDWGNGVDLTNVTYPLGFSSLLNFFHVLFKFDYYYTAHFLSILIYSLSFVFLSAFFIKRIKLRNINFIYPAVFLGLLSYLPIQYVNQSFYGSVSLAPFLFALIFLIFEVFKNAKDVNYFLLILFLSVSLLIYSLTVFLWLGLLILLLILISIKNKKNNLSFKKIIISFFVFILLSWPFLIKSMRLFYIFLFLNKGTESSFFGAVGNMYGFPSILTVFSSWFSSDFRIVDSVVSYKYSIFIFIVLIFFTMISLIFIKKSVKKIFYIDVFILFLVFLLTWIFSYFVLKSPYYFGKTIFYPSIFIMSFLYLLIFLILFQSKKTFLISIGILIFIIFLNNSLISINYLGLPPIDKFLKIQQMEIDLKDNEVGTNLVVVDDEDWLKYFLYDFGSCITFVRTSSCGLDKIEQTSDGRIKLKNESYYLVGKKYYSKIIFAKTNKTVFDNGYYSLVKNN